MRYHQTDKAFTVPVNKYGCLWFQHMNIAELYTGHNFIHKTIFNLYLDVTDKGIMRKDCYINDHVRSIQEALEIFDCHDKVTYAGAWYNEKETDRKSWGERFGMYMVLQMRTKNGNGHFTSMHYDSYLPEIKFTNIISIRYYNIGI